jgi:hypothetical protein
MTVADVASPSDQNSRITNHSASVMEGGGPLAAVVLGMKQELN